MSWNQTRLAWIAPALFLMTALAADAQAPAKATAPKAKPAKVKTEDIRVPLGLLPIQWPVENPIRWR